MLSLDHRPDNTTDTAAPPGFDPRRFPIISRHFYGIKPLVENASNAPPHVRDLRLQRDVVCLHRLGPRTLYELLAEIGRRRQCLTLVEDCTRRYVELDPATLKQLGGDVFPPPPLREAS